MAVTTLPKEPQKAWRPRLSRVVQRATARSESDQRYAAIPTACTRLPISIIRRGPKASTSEPIANAAGIVSSAESESADPISTRPRSVIARK